MKKVLFAFFPWFLFAFGYKTMAQDDVKTDKKEAEEIIIRKKGSNKDCNLNVQINGDKITINGKPLSEFKDDNVTINKRKMSVLNGDRDVFAFGDDFANGSMGWSSDDEGHAFLGVSTEKTEEGAKIVDDVSKESAAGKAGLQKGDIILKFDDTKIEGPQSLYEAVNAKKPKDEVKITYKRDGKEKTVKAVLGERKSSLSKSYSYSSPDGSYKTYTLPFAYNGDELKELGSIKGMDQLEALDMYTDRANMLNDRLFARRQKLGLKIQDTEEANGVKVLEVEDSSTAFIAGLKKDDIITQVGDEKITNTDEAREQFQENKEKGTYPIKVKRGGSEMTFTIKIPKKLKTTNL